MGQILNINDYAKPDHGCHGKGCALCPPRTYAQAVIDLRARRMASEPRVELPVDVEDGEGVA